MHLEGKSMLYKWRTKAIFQNKRVFRRKLQFIASETSQQRKKIVLILKHDLQSSAYIQTVFDFGLQGGFRRLEFGTNLIKK